MRNKFNQISKSKQKAITSVGNKEALFISSKFQEAVALHNSGNLEQAGSIYEEILRFDPKHFDAIYLSGLLASQKEEWDTALNLFNQALIIRPTHFSVYNNRGNALKELKLYEEAILNYKKSIEFKHDFAQAYLNLADVLFKLKRLDEAIDCYELAIKFNPNHAEYYYKQATILSNLNRLDEALLAYDKAIQLNSLYVEAYSDRGVLLYKLRRYNEALFSYNKAIEYKNDYAEAYSNRAVILKDLKQFDEALASYNKAIELKPNLYTALSNRGNLLKELNFLEEAILGYEQSIICKPDYADSYNNFGLLLADLRRYKEAFCNYEKATKVDPNLAQAHANKSIISLVLGEFKEGWNLFEWRWRTESLMLQNRNFSQPLWLGQEELQGKAILLHAEQGLGDTIQFCRYVKLVKALGSHVILEVPQALVGLLSQLEGVDELIPAGVTLPAFDYHCPLMSLPLAFKTDLTSIPDYKPYLAISSQKHEIWQNRLGVKKKSRIGLVWSGSTSHKNDNNRSITLAQLLPYLPADYEYVTLQKEVREIDRLPLNDSNIKYYGDELKDYTDTAALCEGMDLVITVDTSVAHLAGSIGKETWILLPYVPDWRWLLDRNDSPWYKSVKLYRQDASRDWAVVMTQVVQDLKSMC